MFGACRLRRSVVPAASRHCSPAFWWRAYDTRAMCVACTMCMSWSSTTSNGTNWSSATPERTLFKRPIHVSCVHEDASYSSERVTLLIHLNKIDDWPLAGDPHTRFLPSSVEDPGGCLPTGLTRLGWYEAVWAGPTTASSAPPARATQRSLCSGAALPALRGTRVQGIRSHGFQLQPSGLPWEGLRRADLGSRRQSASRAVFMGIASGAAGRGHVPPRCGPHHLNTPPPCPLRMRCPRPSNDAYACATDRQAGCVSYRVRVRAAGCAGRGSVLCSVRGRSESCQA